MRCNDVQLRNLLVADESSSEYQAIANHVEGCSRCQQRLVELSGDIALQNEVRDTLRVCGETEPYYSSVGSSVVISVESRFDEEFVAECEPVSLDFLAPASHPEMLGRIGRYDVERMIGTGGMGVVLKGFDTELHRVVAIKVLKPHLAHIGAARHRFAREAQSAAAVVHEHVIPIYDVQSDGDTPFLVMQYVPGQSLQARVDEHGPLSAKEVLRIGRQVAAGLAAAHAQGLVHRDVKPANILMEESVERILISDFGLARTVDDATLTRTGIVAGTPHYMSPEQASGHVVDHRSDLFSLGSVLYFMCTGRPPFRAEHALAILHRICNDAHRPVDEVNHEVPAELAEVIDQLLSKKPGNRYRNAKDVELKLESILARLQTGRPSRRLRWTRSWQRWRTTVAQSTQMLGIAALCAIAGAGLSHLPWRPSSSTSNEVTTSGQPNLERQSDERTAQLLPSDSSNASSPPESAVGAVLIESTPVATLPDALINAFEELSKELERIERRWNSRSALDFAPADDAWYRELQQIEGFLKDLDGQLVPADPVLKATSKPLKRNKS